MSPGVPRATPRSSAPSPATGDGPHIPHTPVLGSTESPRRNEKEPRTRRICTAHEECQGHVRLLYLKIHFATIICKFCCCLKKMFYLNFKGNQCVLTKVGKGSAVFSLRSRQKETGCRPNWTHLQVIRVNSVLNTRLPFISMSFFNFLKFLLLLLTKSAHRNVNLWGLARQSITYSGSFV